MKIVFLLAILGGFGGTLAGAHFVPWLKHARLPSHTSVVANGGRSEQFVIRLPADRLAATDLGWKDTVLSWPGETVRIVTDFSHPFLGDQVYMVHCHNLEHEDGGMMLNMKVAS